MWGVALSLNVRPAGPATAPSTSTSASAGSAVTSTSPSRGARVSETERSSPRPSSTRSSAASCPAFVSRTACWRSGATVISSGVSPRNSPSTRTAAPGGSLATRSRPGSGSSRNGGTASGRSATTSIARAAGACPASVAVTARRPELRSTVSGVRPTSAPSTRTVAPAGVDVKDTGARSGASVARSVCSSPPPATLRRVAKGVYPSARSEISCSPAGTSSGGSGVVPRSAPSTNTRTPCAGVTSSTTCPGSRSIAKRATWPRSAVTVSVSSSGR